MVKIVCGNPCADKNNYQQENTGQQTQREAGEKQTTDARHIVLFFEWLEESKDGVVNPNTK
jgi:hypothetical protein